MRQAECWKCKQARGATDYGRCVVCGEAIAEPLAGGPGANATAIAAARLGLGLLLMIGSLFLLRNDEWCIGITLFLTGCALFGFGRIAKALKEYG